MIAMKQRWLSIPAAIILDILSLSGRYFACVVISGAYRD